VGPGKHLLHIADRFEANTVLYLFNTIQQSSFCLNLVTSCLLRPISLGLKENVRQAWALWCLKNLLLTVYSKHGSLCHVRCYKSV